MKGTVGADSVWFIVELVSPGAVGVSRVVANKTGRVIKEQSAVIMPPGNVQDLLQYTEQW